MIEAQEKSFGLIVPHPEQEITIKIYQDLYQSVKLFSEKLSDKVAKVVSTLTDNKSLGLGYLAHLEDAKYNTGAFVLQGEAVNLVILNAQILELCDSRGYIEMNTDKATICSYFHFIRAAVALKYNKDDTELVDMIADYLTFSFFKSAKRKIVVTDELRDIINRIIKYFIYRIHLNIPHAKVLYDLFTTKTDREKFDSMKNYKKFQEFINAFIDFDIISGNAAQYLVDYIKLVGPFSYYSFIESFMSLVAAIICSLYPTDVFRQAFLNRILQQKIEDHVYRNYVTKVDVVPFPQISKSMGG